MHTLEQLASGELKGTKMIKMALGLTEFPKEILDYSDSLEILDLTGNKLSRLPTDFSVLTNLKIAFFSDNEFVEFPSVLSKCPKLEMIGFKSNRISKIEEEALPIQTRWLILTNNKLSSLPISIGNCTRLQKCMLAGNLLSSLPDQMSNCKNLELLRISANSFISFPRWLFSMPKLSWLALAGNPCSKAIDSDKPLKEIDWSNLHISEILGQGASGIIYRAIWMSEQKAIDVAVKIFKGEITSDGLPMDEMNACIYAGYHENLVPVLGKIKNQPDGMAGLVLGLIPPNYSNLAGPPSFDTCTRDVFPKDKVFNLDQILKICKGIASVLLHLHHQGISHGDLYAHNILINDLGDPLFGDFGAASIYDKNDDFSCALEKIEVRAFGCLLEDLIMNMKTRLEGEHLTHLLVELKNSCLHLDVDRRPSFSDIDSVFDTIFRL